jgi:hypothetical protein
MSYHACRIFVLIVQKRQVLGEYKMSRKNKRKNKSVAPRNLSKSIADDSTAIKKEIEELQAKKAKIIAVAKTDLQDKKGLKKFGSKLGYSRQVIVLDKAIKEREQYLNNKFRLKNLYQQKKFNDAKKQLRAAETVIKPITEDDIFGNLLG